MEDEEDIRGWSELPERFVPVDSNSRDHTREEAHFVGDEGASSAKETKPHCEGKGVMTKFTPRKLVPRTMNTIPRAR